MQRRLRNVQKSVMHVQRCCFVNLTLLLFCRRRRRCLSSLATERELQLTTTRANKQLAWLMTERQNRYRKSRLVPSRPFPSSNDVPVLLLNQPKVEPGSTFTFTRDPPPLMFGLCLVIRSSGSSYVSRKLSTYSSPKPTLTLTSHLGLRGPIFLPISQLKRSQYQEVLGTIVTLCR